MLTIFVFCLSSDCSDTTKDSLATAMRHSRRHAQETYDRRNICERKSMAFDLASQFSEAGQDSPTELEGGGQFSVGDFVGLVEESSTLDDPRVLIARIQSFQPVRQACLIWYKEAGKHGQYTFEYDPEPWVEDIDNLHPVKMTPLSKNPGNFKLMTSQKSIHKAICGMD